MLFENKTVLTLEDFILLQTTWEKYKSPLRRFKRMQRLCFALPGIILFLLGANNVWNALQSFSLAQLPITVLSILLVLVGLFLVLWPGGSSLAKRNWRKYAQKGSVLTYIFEEKGFTHQSPDGTQHIPYGALVDLMEDDRAFLLFFSDFGAHVLHKDSFTTGDADHFRAFLTERTGLAMRKV